MPFPSNFIWATATAAYQVEEPGTHGGRGLSTWDVIRSEGGRIADGSKPGESIEGCKKWQEDIENIRFLGVTHYRFSISWSRIFPSGIGKVNQEGVDFYRKFVVKLKENGIEPIGSLFHADLPYELFKVGGWTNPELIADFTEFARFCFTTFGDLVRTWITINEIQMHAWSGLAKFEGEPYMAPTGLEFSGKRENIPYIVAHNMLLAHARTYRMYKTEFKQQNGSIGIAATGRCVIGGDKGTNKRANDQYTEWTIWPLIFGEYPESMRRLLDGKEGAPSLPKFTEEEQNMIRGSLDFLGFNYYCPVSIENGIGSTPREKDGQLKLKADDWEQISGPDSWVRCVPEALYDLLMYCKTAYNNIPVLITENGCADYMGPEKKEPLEDGHRIRYIEQHVDAVERALTSGCNIIGYTSWSLMDNFEWDDGFAVKFGLFRIDISDPEKKRIPKKSAYFYRELIKKHRK